MSGGTAALELTEQDLTLILAASAHIGNKNSNFQMKEYIYGVQQSGAHIFKARLIWEKVLLAARAIAAVPNPSDVIAIGTRTSCQRACLKFQQYCNATAIAQRFTPGAFTNQIQACFREPRMLVVSDPVADHQPISEAAAVNIPVIAFCNSDTPLAYVDIAIPCNNKSPEAIGLMWWMLAREVRRIKGFESRNKPWDVMVDMFISRSTLDEPEVEEADELYQPGLDTAGMDVEASEWTAENGMAVPGMPAVGTMDAMANYGQTAAAGGNWMQMEPDASWQ